MCMEICMEKNLFRGKAVDRWVEGSLLVFPNTGRTKILKWNQADLDFDQIEVKSETVGQCTLMYDKHDKMIFDGDIIYRDWFGGRIYQVTYDNQFGRFIGVTADGCFTTFDGDSDSFEIIGNVHDNPELMGD